MLKILFVIHRMISLFRAIILLQILPIIYAETLNSSDFQQERHKRGDFIQVLH